VKLPLLPIRSVEPTIRAATSGFDTVPTMWSLSPGVRHLNHGSFGAVPLEVQAIQDEWRGRWEANTTRFILNDFQPALDQSRGVLASFVRADPDGLVFVRNATTAIASVVRSMEPFLGPGDELLTTAHDYNAVRQTLEHTAERTGASVVVAEIPFPIESGDQVVQSIDAAVTTRTKLAVIDHVTSPTGLVYPIETIIAHLEPEIPVAVDGAHAPGQVPLALEDLGASWFTGNLHKWVCAPKGAAFLSTRSDRRDMTMPVVVSHGRNATVSPTGSRYRSLFDWIGTDDMSQWLTVPTAIDVVGRLETGGWPALMERNHRMALAARDLLCSRLEIDKPAPDEMVGAMAAIPLPSLGGVDTGSMNSPLVYELLDLGYETAVMVWPEWPSQVLRISAHHYNTLDEYVDLADELSMRVG
jgi:isopenicillin-N epimerase